MVDLVSNRCDVPPGNGILGRLLVALPGRSDPFVIRRAFPWEVREEDGAIALRLVRLREEELSDPANRDLLIACGAVLVDLRLIGARHGVDLETSLFPAPSDDTLVARLTLAAGKMRRNEMDEAEDQALARVLDHAAADGPPPTVPWRHPSLLDLLNRAARMEGAWLDVIADEARRELLSDVVMESGVIAGAERAARRLICSMLGDAAPASATLAPGGAPQIGELLAALGARVAAPAVWASGDPRTARAQVLEAPLLLVLGTSGDTPHDWVRAGRAVQRVLLQANVRGLVATFVNEPLQHPLLREAVQSIVHSAGVPQAVIRFHQEWEVPEARSLEVWRVYAHG